MNEFVSEVNSLFPDRLLVKHNLKNYTTLKIGGDAEYFINCTSYDDLKKLLEITYKYKIKVTILGGMSNVLISDKGVGGLVIKNTAHNILLKNVIKSNGHELVYLSVDSGTPMSLLVNYCIQNGLTGLEEHLGLPGSVGGAIFMNSKWTKPLNYVGDSLYQAEIFTEDGKFENVNKSFFNFAYDYSSLQKVHNILTKVIFVLEKSSKELVNEEALKCQEYRKLTQPKGLNTMGCTFRNISTLEAITYSTPGQIKSAGYLIDKAGLKGKSVGGAKISEHHANFIINDGSATANDVRELIQLCKVQVKNKFNINLNEEIVYIGDF